MLRERHGQQRGWRGLACSSHARAAEGGHIQKTAPPSSPIFQLEFYARAREQKTRSRDDKDAEFGVAIDRDRHRHGIELSSVPSTAALFRLLHVGDMSDDEYEDLPSLLDDEYEDAEGADSTAIVMWPVPLPHGRNGTVGVVHSAGGSGKTTILGSILSNLRVARNRRRAILGSSMHMHVLLWDEAPTTGLKYMWKYMLKPEDHRALLCKL